MNETTEKLLSELAQKMGVTVDMLWAALIKQAPIEACTNIAQIILGFLFLASIWVWRAHLDKDGKDEDTYIISTIITYFITFFFLIGSIVALSEIVAGFLNPEYWALKELTKMFKRG